jgi:hypothetical protein
MGSENRPAVFLHIGAPKTGTTYVQDLLWRNREALRRDGLLVPGRRRPAHYWAGMDLRRTTFRGHRPAPVSGAWTRLVEEVRTWQASAVIDDELLSRADAAEVDRALADLHFAEVHLVYSVRDMARTLPAAWQERVKNQAGASASFREFLDVVSREDREARLAEWFWSAHDLPAVLERWSRALPPERVHVLTVPTSRTEPDALWQRFAGLLGLDPARYDTRSTRRNLSLGAVEVEVLRRANAAFGETTMRWPAYHDMVKRCLTPALASREGVRIALPEPAYAWACDWAEQATKAVDEAGYDVVGDLSELLPSTRPSGRDPESTSSDEQLEAAVAGMRALMEGWHSTTKSLAEAQARADRAERQLRRREVGAPRSRVRRGLVVLSERVPGGGAALRGYRRVRRVLRPAEARRG